MTSTLFDCAQRKRRNMLQRYSRTTVTPEGLQWRTGVHHHTHNCPSRTYPQPQSPYRISERYWPHSKFTHPSGPFEHFDGHWWGWRTTHPNRKELVSWTSWSLTTLMLLLTYCTCACSDNIIIAILVPLLSLLLLIPAIHVYIKTSAGFVTLSFLTDEDPGLGRNVWIKGTWHHPVNFRLVEFWIIMMQQPSHAETFLMVLLTQKHQNIELQQRQIKVLLTSKQLSLKLNCQK